MPRLFVPALSGRSFGRLLVLACEGQASDTRRNRLWRCECQCGAVVNATEHSLISGKRKSCGCFQRETRLNLGTVARGLSNRGATPSDDDYEVRFWCRVRSSRDGCWVWTRGTQHNGYGTFCVKGRDIRAHRFSWEIHFGQIPQGMLVCHHCDNPPCVRPDHLFLGTDRDNCVDKLAKGRGRAGIPFHRGCSHEGALNPNARMSTEQVAEALSRLADGEKPAAVASSFGVSTSLIYKIRSRRAWSHLN